MRDFGRFLSEFQPGFFRYRWTDQTFFHFALGLFAGPDFRTFVADYTELRCFPWSCWWERDIYTWPHPTCTEAMTGVRVLDDEPLARPGGIIAI